MIKLAARVGIIGPILLATVIALLTLFKFDFLLSIGWHPLNAPTFDWPSGLALGDFGWIMTATFLLSGLMMAIFASGLRLSLSTQLKTSLPRTSLTFFATLALTCAGLALAGLAFTTDPTNRVTPATWHGRLHDLSFVILGLTLMPAMILLGFAFQKDERWKNLSAYTWITVALAFPAFWLKGAAFYVFMLAVLIWSEVVALRLRSVAN
ncbi:MAG TPA: DUF998 domain-containing protein [Anaerolineales bacterium]|nr:DUF998 domain-containing protein [Anaerolineales bacterium]HNQ94841.1 DUF998 domain-containing protein [Anaerolineales bacterium]HNS59785.1 DUF998 domain-containing protein [Anaerolineales bacterium]